MRTPRDRREIWPEFLELWEELRQASAEPGTIVVVEGERDRASLRRLGLPGPVMLLHHGHTLSQLAQELGSGPRRVIVLTDWDTEGGHFAQRLRELLRPGPAEIDLEFRRRLAQLLHGDLAHVEGLAGWARRTAEGIGAPLDHFVGSAQG